MECCLQGWDPHAQVELYKVFVKVGEGIQRGYNKDFKSRKIKVWEVEFSLQISEVEEFIYLLIKYL